MNELANSFQMTVMARTAPLNLFRRFKTQQDMNSFSCIQICLFARCDETKYCTYSSMLRHIRILFLSTALTQNKSVDASARAVP